MTGTEVKRRLRRWCSRLLSRRLANAVWTSWTPLYRCCVVTWYRLHALWRKRRRSIRDR